MVRSTLPHLHLWTGLRLILGVPALMHDFDPLTPYFWQKYLTDQEILRSYFRTMLELWVGLIWARLDDRNPCSGEEMCHQKCQNFDKKSNFWWFFKNDPRSTWNRSKTKKHNFNTKIIDFKIKWCEALSLTFLSAAPSADFGVPALVRNFDPLIQYFW